jgi:ubiquinone/menaquinone biosynthesis C-methylase UbiE
MEHGGSALIDPQLVLGRIGLQPGMRVADLGCGRTGHFIFLASKIVGDTGSIYAVDLMKDILGSIQSRIRTEGYDNIHAVWSDIERVGFTPIPETSLDICFFVNVLSMVTDKSSALLEAARLLKPDGRVVIIDWLKNLGPLGPVPEKQVRPEMIGQLAKPAGFEVLDEFSAGEYHFGIILKKLEEKVTGI